MMDYEDYELEQQATQFVRFYGLVPQNNFFTCYQYFHPIFEIIPFPPLLDGYVTKIVLFVITPEEVIVKRIGSGLKLVSLKEREFTKNVIKIKKSEMLSFHVKEWSVLGFYLGYLITLKTAQKNYYFHVGKTTGTDFSTENFFELNRKKFLGWLN
ncbi:hypothetical protein NG891_16735 [Enterococcus gallinarum]|uniref:hypothetical protein n=1 Tax=Enterococcus gallinarum TaxID=1353 RepID=UPI0020913A06|nr:hypothetical protein [Enterococcus gallinarum]MCO5478379.1 hypothetical protein [Enterococcus gallinarum]